MVAAIVGIRMVRLKKYLFRKYFPDVLAFPLYDINYILSIGFYKIDFN